MKTQNSIPQIIMLSILGIVLLLFCPESRQFLNMPFSEYTQLLESFQRKNPSYETPTKTQSGSLRYMKLNSKLRKFFQKKNLISKIPAGKKLVLYVKPLETNISETKRANIFRSYAQSNEWKKGYVFYEYDPDKFLDTNNKNVAFDEALSFAIVCGNFCIVDFENDSIYLGEETSTSDYINKVMAEFYGSDKMK